MYSEEDYINYMGEDEYEPQGY